MLPIFSFLQIVNLDKIITKINIIKAIIFTIIIITIMIAVSHGKKSVTFVVKKVITLINILIISNGKQKNFEDKIKNPAEIKANIRHFWLIIKGIEMIILMIIIKKQIIQMTMIKITYNIS